MTRGMGKTSSSKASTRRRDVPEPSSPAVRRRMQVTRRRDTSAELSLRSALRALGLRYRVDAPLPGTRRRADVSFLRAKVAVFQDGCFWHGCPEHGTWPKANAKWWREKIEGNQRRDRDTERRLTDAGWVVLRFWEHADAEAAAQCIARTVANRLGEISASRARVARPSTTP